MDSHFYQLAVNIKNQENIITLEDTDEIFLYDMGKNLYVLGETKIKTYIQEQMGQDISTHKVNEVLNYIRRATYVSRENLEVDKRYIPLEHKILDMETMELLDYSPEFYFFRKHPITLTSIPENIDNPISEWLGTIVGTIENEVMLKEIVGYCFYRAMPFQNLFLLVGTGGNGKSVYLNILEKMLGQENYTGMSIHQLGDPSDRFSKGKLYQKNANIFGDLSQKSLSDVSTIKQLTGNDTITAEIKFGGHFSFRNYAKLIASCNALPETPEYGDAWIRRPVIINFPYSFIGKENRELFEQLSTQENLNKFLIDCLYSLKDAIEANQLIKNEDMETKRKIYMQYSNSGLAFIDECLDYDPESFLTTEQIYCKYKEYCIENKLIRQDERQFFKGVYKFFNNKVWKKRKAEYVDGKEIRTYIIEGIEWK